MAASFDPAKHRPKTGADSLPKCTPCRISRQVCNYPLGRSICTRCQSSSTLECKIDEQGRRTHFKKKENRGLADATVESNENETADEVGDVDDEDTERNGAEVIVYHSVQFAGLSNSLLNRDSDRDLFNLAKIVLNPLLDKHFNTEPETSNCPLQPILCCGTSFQNYQPSSKENTEAYKELHAKMYFVFSHVGPENAFIGTPAGVVPWAKYECFLGTLAKDDEGARTFRLFGLLHEYDLTSTTPDFDEIFVDRGEFPDIVAAPYEGSEAVLVKGAEVEYRCLTHKSFVTVEVTVLRYSPAAPNLLIIDGSDG